MKRFLFVLKVNAYKLFNNKYKIASIQTANTEVLAFIVVLVFKLLSFKVLFKKVGYFLRKYQISWVNYCKFINSWNATIFRIFLKYISDYLSLLCLFVRLYL